MPCCCLFKKDNPGDAGEELLTLCTSGDECPDIAGYRRIGLDDCGVSPPGDDDTGEPTDVMPSLQIMPSSQTRAESFMREVQRADSVLKKLREWGLDASKLTKF